MSKKTKTKGHISTGVGSLSVRQAVDAVLHGEFTNSGKKQQRVSMDDRVGIARALCKKHGGDTLVRDAVKRVSSMSGHAADRLRQVMGAPIQA